MIIRELDEVLGPVGTARLPRTDGLHLSEVISFIVRSLGQERLADWNREASQAVGLIWEEVMSCGLASSHSANLIRPGEIEVDGVICTPDGIDLDLWAVVEYKATWRSSRTKPWEVLPWMLQAKGYCRAVGTDTVIMRVLYVMGDYRGSGPLYYPVMLRFEPTEIEEAWRSILIHAEMLRSEGRTKG